MVKDYFKACEKRFPKFQSELRRISLALRREQIVTMEQLCDLQKSNPEDLLAVRSIGEKSFALIEIVCAEYQFEKHNKKEAASTRNGIPDMTDLTIELTGDSEKSYVKSDIGDCTGSVYALSGGNVDIQSGTPSQEGEFSFTVIAQNTNYHVSKTFQFTIAEYTSPASNPGLLVIL